ncbi:MAG: hypothetical protein ROW39_06765, partial [Anaerolineaceae bacterium]
MDLEILTRLLWAAIILFTGFAVYWLYSQAIRRRLASRRPPGGVWFWGPAPLSFLFVGGGGGGAG